MLGKYLATLAWLMLVVIFTTGCDQNQTRAADTGSGQELCDFNRGPCQISVGENTITLTASPNSVPSEKPLTFQLNFSHTVQIIQSRIEGRDMFMGVIPVKWTQTNEMQYQATVTYGACSSGYMVWRLWISYVDKQGKQVETWFDFKADNHS